jgi:hypothetical protein
MDGKNTLADNGDLARNRTPRHKAQSRRSEHEIWRLGLRRYLLSPFPTGGSSQQQVAKRDFLWSYPEAVARAGL